MIACSHCLFYIGSTFDKIKNHFYYSRHLMDSNIWNRLPNLLSKLDLHSPDTFANPTVECLSQFQHSPIFNGFRCTKCALIGKAYYCKKKSSLNEHLRLTHNSNDKADWEKCLVQKPFGGKKSVYYGVTSITSEVMSSENTINRSHLDSFIDDVLSTPLLPQQSSRGMNYNFYVIGWSQFIQQNHQELQKLEQKKLPMALEKLPERLLNLLEKFEEVVQNRSCSIFIQNCVMDQMDFSKPLLPLQEMTSKKEYARYLSFALWFSKSEQGETDELIKAVESNDILILNQFLILECTKEISPSVGNDFEFLFYRYLCLSCSKNDQTFIEISTITHRISILIYFLRVSVFLEICKFRTSVGEPSFGKNA